jgi:pimeloyl-ACP methyl ester carboxylesterase
VDITSSHLIASDGTSLAIHEMGEGRALLLFHGFFSDAQTNWIKYGHGAQLAAAGHRVIMPDLRGHGQSAKPHDPAAYPKDILADDGLAIIAHLGLRDFDLGGYSLGGRTVARMLARGATPSRVIISGMGLQGIADPAPRAAYFRQVFANLGHHPKGSPEWMAEAFLKTTEGDANALALLLETFVATPVEAMARWAMPVQVLAGADDHDNGSSADLAAQIANATHTIVPGNHMSAVTKPDLGAAMVEFLRRA